jgi:hypothetical protein
MAWPRRWMDLHSGFTGCNVNDSLPLPVLFRAAQIFLGKSPKSATLAINR